MSALCVGEVRQGRARRSASTGGSCCTFPVVREELRDKMTFEQVLKRHEGTSCEDLWEKSISGRGTARAKALRWENGRGSKEQGSECG